MLFFLFTKKAQHATSAAAAPANERGSPRKRSGLEGGGQGRQGRATISKSNSKAAAAGLPVQRVQSPKSNQRKILNVPRRELCRAQAPIKNSLLSARAKAKDSGKGVGEYATPPRNQFMLVFAHIHTHTQKFSGLFQC